MPQRPPAIHIHRIYTYTHYNTIPKGLLVPQRPCSLVHIISCAEHLTFVQKCVIIIMRTYICERLLSCSHLHTLTQHNVGNNDMAHVPAKRVLRTDYCDLSAVIELAKAFGPGQFVVKHDGRPNYNIIHKSRRDLWDKPSVQVMYDTDKHH